MCAQYGAVGNDLSIHTKRNLKYKRAEYKYAMYGGIFRIIDIFALCRRVE